MKPNARSAKQALYQVNVEATAQGSRVKQMLPVGPAMMRAACDQFADTIRQQIKLGREKRWSNPTVVPIISLEN